MEGWNFCSCEAGQGKRKEMLLKYSGIPDVHFGDTLENFKPRKGAEEALLAATEMAWGNLCWLLIYGGVGNGKTHLAYAVVLEYINQGRGAKFVYCPSVVTEIRYSSGEKPLKLLQELQAVPLLVMDDFYYSTDWEGQRLEEVINQRYMRKLPLMLTTNKDIATIPKSILSRFREMGKVKLNKAPDFRGTKGG